MKKVLLLGILFPCLLHSCSGEDNKWLTPAKLDYAQTHFYVNSQEGNDGNKGDSPDYPLKSLYMLQQAHLKAGDSIFIARGTTLKGSIVLRNVYGTEKNPVVITSYGDKNLENACIDARGQLSGILLENCSHVKVSKIHITANGSGSVSDKEARNAGMRCGLLYRVTKDGNYEGITLSELKVDNIYIEEKGYNRDPDDVNSANGTEQYGWGIRFINESLLASLSHIKITDCEVEKISHTGIKLTGKKLNITDLEISGCTVQNVGGPGIQMGGVKGAHVHHNRVNRSGSTEDSRHWGRGSGYWCFGSNQVLVEYNRFTNANGPNDSAGAHIDYNCANVIYQYNFSANNLGAFCEILGNNKNCCYRYNISVNDGQRKNENNATPGYTFLISGYTGENSSNIGPFNSYIYNNTIYTDADKVSRIAITRTAEGIYIANNIFHIQGNSVAIKTNQFAGPATNALMENNLFLTDTSWNKDNHVSDSSPIYGDADFQNPKGMELEDYTPRNKKLVQNMGIKIEPLPNDEIGLYMGLEVTHDILGNLIKSNPDFGAIEVE